jgi:hypothetical protein
LWKKSFWNLRLLVKNMKCYEYTMPEKIVVLLKVKAKLK